MPPQHVNVPFPSQDFPHFRRSRILAAHSGPARRLVVLLHGFCGSATRTWRGFEPSNLPKSPWWLFADLVFIEYSSLMQEIALTATRMRHLVAKLLDGGPPGPATADERTYEELVLIGHSMGGVVLRAMILEVATASKISSNQVADADERIRNLMLEARLRLFAPATSGARLAGLLGVAGGRTSRTLRASPTYQELVDPSLLLLPLRHRTEEELCKNGAGSASCIWASRDRVVTHGVPYATDAFDGFLRGTHHLSVCKPALVPAAIEFVENGSVPVASLEGR